MATAREIEFQFDPGVITENGKTYMYTGFCGREINSPRLHVHRFGRGYADYYRGA